MAELVGKRYAEALFEVGLEMEQLDTFKDEISAVSDVIEGEPKLKTILQHPKLSKGEKKDIINALFEGKVSKEMLNLLYIIVDKGRERALSDIKKEYIALTHEHQGIVEAQAITAVAMDGDEKTKLQEKLSKKLDKQIILENVVDSSVIGGVLLRIKDRVIDSSIKGQLEMIQKQLNNTRLSK